MSIYEKHSYESPALPFIFHTDTRAEEVMMGGANWHENPELLAFIGGAGKVRINAEEYEVETGDIVVINSNCLHEFSTPDTMTYRVLIIDKAFFAENAIDLDGIHFSTRFRDPLLSEAIEELNEFFKLPEDAPWRTLLIRSKIMSILERLCSGHSEGYDKTRGEREELLSAIKRAIGIIHARYSERLTLESLATEIGISKYYFSREFHRLTGYSPISYLNLTRCENAKLLLTRQKSIMEVAEAVGYEDQSYFTRIFRRTIGITPTEYKQLR